MYYIFILYYIKIIYNIFDLIRNILDFKILIKIKNKNAYKFCFLIYSKNIIIKTIYYDNNNNKELAIYLLLL